jgi:hypothetical protein
VKREDLAHILRAASQIADEHDVLVVGSQSILGTYSEDQLPDAAVASVEADVTFFWDDDDKKSEMVDGALGEDSMFHSTFGYYAQGVSVTSPPAGATALSSSRTCRPSLGGASAWTGTTSSSQSSWRDARRTSRSRPR